MSDPRKLIDDSPDALTKNLLQSALDDDPSPRVLHRTAAALGVAGIATGTAKAAGATAGAKLSMKLSGTMLLKWFGVGATAGVLAAGAADLAERRQAPIARLESVATGLAPSIAKGLDAVREPTEASPVEATTENERPARTSPPAVLPSASGARVPAKSPTIAAEIAALDRARSALRQNDPASALSTIDELERAAANAPGASALAPETTVIRAEALLARGEKSKAKALARRFVARNPQSPHVNRMLEIAQTRE